jgi:hypothetical protein
VIPDLGFLKDKTARSQFFRRVQPWAQADAVKLTTALKKQLDAMPPASPPPQRRASWQSDLAATLVRMQSLLTAEDDSFLLTAIDAINLHETNKLLDSYTKLLRKDPRKAWKYIRAVNLKSRAVLPAANSRARMQAFHTHFSQLFAPKPPPEPPPTFPKQPHVHFKTGAFSEDEIRDAQRRLQCGKSVGVDGVPNEILKCHELTYSLKKVLDKMYLEGVPAQLAIATMVPLPKKGNLAETTNWRGIALLPHITKLYNTVLLERLRAIDPHLSPMQNGFRKGRGTAHHVMCAREILDFAATRRTL